MPPATGSIEDAHDMGMTQMDAFTRNVGFRNMSAAALACCCDECDTSCAKGEAVP